MGVYEYLTVATLGGSSAIVIALLSQSRYPALAALATLFPTFALLAHVTSFNLGGSAQVRTVACFGLLALLPYAAYLATIVLAVDRFGFSSAIGLALMAWGLLAVFAFYAWQTLA